jgi:hypothetical protein
MTATTLRAAEPARYRGPLAAVPSQILDAALLHARAFETIPASTALHDAFLDVASRATTRVESLLASTLLQVARTDGYEMYRRIADIGTAERAVQQHEQTTGHDICCGYHCDCAPGPRCDTCQTAPHEGLEQAVAQLLDIPAQRLSAHVHDQTYAAATELAGTFTARCTSCRFTTTGGWQAVGAGARLHETGGHRMQLMDAGRSSAALYPRDMWAAR